MATIIPSNPILPISLQSPAQPYAMGWSSIALELATRLKNLPLIGSAHPFLKWIKGSAESNEWQAQFMAERADGREVVNTWLINLESSMGSKVSQDDSSKFTSRSTVQLWGYLEIEDPITWDLWSAILRQIDQDLLYGDRTLNKTCLTYSLPEPSISEFGQFAGVDCHCITAKITIEESGTIGEGKTILIDSSIISAFGEIICTGNLNVESDSDTLNGDV